MASRFSAFECALIRGAFGGREQPLGMVSGRVQHPQAQGGKSGQKFLAARHLQRIQMILDAQGREEVALDIQLAAEIGIGQRQRIAVRAPPTRRPRGCGTRA